MPWYFASLSLFTSDWVTAEDAVTVPALKARVVDTTGAGDCFVGALAARMMAGATPVEAARYASVHGTNYQKDTGNGAVTKVNIYNAAIVPQASGLDLSQLTYTINYNAPAAADWPW